MFDGFEMDIESGLPAIESVKDAFPFRLGTTSYIIPDNLVPNVEYLAPLIDDIELVLFESDEVSNLPGPEAIGRLSELKETWGLSYTVHLPLDIRLGSSDNTVRSRSVGKCLRVMHLTKRLQPFSYIIHFEGANRGQKPAQQIDLWRSCLERSVKDLLTDGIDSQLLSVESLDYPLQYIADIVDQHNLSICLDVGHLAFYGYPIREYLDHYMAASRVIHLHGSHEGRDHRDIGKLSPEIMDLLINRLKAERDRERVLTLEIFGWNDFRKSMESIKRWAV
jgi:sugar phosphate isomerase/epimerase